MPQDNTAKQLIINQLTKEQYNELVNNSQLSSSELYVITDDNHYTENEIVTLLATKQDLLTVGENIIIDDNNVISLDLTNVYLKEEIDNLLNDKANSVEAGYSLTYEEDILTLKNKLGEELSSVKIRSFVRTDDITVSFNDQDKIQSIGEITKKGTPKFTWIGTQEEYEQDILNGVIDEYTECLITDSEAEGVTPVVQFEAPTKLSDLANDMDFTTNAVVQEIKSDLLEEINKPFDESNLVHKNGTEVIDGFKIFSNEITLQNADTKGRIVHKNTLSNTPSITDGYIEFGENTLKYGKESEEGLMYHTSNDIFHSGNLVAGNNITIVEEDGVYKINGQAGGGTGGEDIVVGTTVYVDEETIVKNDEEVITAVGVKSKNDTILYDWVGTLEEYNASVADGTIQSNWICWITDDDNTSNNTTANKQTYGSDVALLDIIVTNQALEGVDKIGKELQGSLVLKSEYPDAYKKLLNQKNKATIVTETINNVEVTYYQCTNGWKVMSIDNKSMYDELFESTGSANFFVLDETSENFYLPKTNNILQPNVNISELGRYNEAGLPNIKTTNTVYTGSTNQFEVYSNNGGCITSQSLGGVTTGGNTGADNAIGINLDASLSNPIYGNSDTVQPQSTNVFIYYKVGNTLQESATIDMEAQILELQNKLTFNMFDTKTSDHILEGEEAIGWALQGSYVYKNSLVERVGYTDFYNKCIEEKNNATPTEVTLGENTITMYINANGHQFYDIANKEAIDTWYNTYGIAWFYGIDEENECIWLPRNKYFALEGVAPVVGNGMTLGLTDGTSLCGLKNATEKGGLVGRTDVYGSSVGSTGTSSSAVFANNTVGITTDPTKSGIEAHLTPDETKYLYICVGNTSAVKSLSNVTDITTTENDTIPLLYSTYQSHKVSSAGWLKADNKSQPSTLYPSVYNYLEGLLQSNPNSIPVVEIGNMIEGEDYTKHFKVNLTNQTFTLPIRTSERVLIAKKEATNEDKTWYNLYSDGWCEQGGTVLNVTPNAWVNIKFLLPLINTNYNLIGSGVETSGQAYADFMFNCKDLTTTGFTAGTRYWSNGASHTDRGYNWRVDHYTQIPTLEEYTEPLYLYFKVGNAVQNLEVIDMLHQADLNTPFFLGMSKYFENTPNNLSWLKSEGQWNSKDVYVSYYEWLEKQYNEGNENVKLHTEEYDDYNFVVNQEECTFRLPLLNGSENQINGNERIDGTWGKAFTLPYNALVFFEAHSNDMNADALIYVTFPNGLRKFWRAHDNGYTFGPTTILPRGTIVEASGGTSYTSVSYIKAQGNGSLYYYVGETVQNANLINAGKFVEKFNSSPHIVETYQNGTSGYRIWSDKYCEQWGFVQMTSANTDWTLLKEMKDLNYNISAVNGNNKTCVCRAQSTTSVHIDFSYGSSDQYGWWKVSGYIK